MKNCRGYRLEIKLNQEQKALSIKSVGTSRFAYNWKLKILSDNYEQAKNDANGEKVKLKIGTSIDWHKEWVLLKNELPWIRETSKCCGQESLRDLEVAFKNFFYKKSGYPKFKKKGQKDSFRIDGLVYVTPTHIRIPTFGEIRLKEKFYPVLEGKVKLSQATISRHADRWFVSFLLKETEELPTSPSTNEINESDIVGVDLGIKELAITSDGQIFENPRAYNSKLKKLKKYQRRVSRKQKGSKNRKKAVMRLIRVHKQISDIRNDAVHKLTTSLVKAKPKMLVIESLKPKNMSKNHKLAGAILDSSFGKIKTTLKYKCEWFGIHLIMAPMFYASSKYCSCCGHKNNELKLSDREWTCKNCNTHHDRDVNAAKNLQYFGLWLIDKHLVERPTTVSSTGSYACGDERLQFLTEQCSSVKQEFRQLYENLVV
jgi:putative transposase